MSESNEPIVNLQTAADVLGVSRESVRQWFAAAAPGRLGRSKIDLGALVRWRVNRADEESQAASGSGSPALEEWRSARAAMAKLELRQREKQLTPTADLIRCLDDVRDAVQSESRQLIECIGLDHALSGAAFGKLEERRLDFLDAVTNRVRRAAREDIPDTRDKKGFDHEDD